MGFGDTAKKIQRLGDVAEQTYEKMNRVVADVQRLREDFESTSERVQRMERDLAEQRAIVEALAERDGVDVESVLAEASVPDANEDGGDNAGSDTADNAGSDTADNADVRPTDT
ncbi:MAG: DUF5798 family protein [Haloarculaceae archaeon]